MTDRLPSLPVKAMALSRLLSLSRPLIVLAYLAGYVLLDWASFIQPLGSFGITPWNPQAGLSFALILLFGQRFLPLLFLAPLLADIMVRGLPLPLPVELLAVLVIGSGYGLAVLFLLQPRWRFDPSLSSMRDLLLLMTVAVVSAVLVACVHVAILLGVKLIAWDDAAIAVMRYWVGDVIGIAGITPFLLILLIHDHLPQPRWEMLAQGATILIALWLVFALEDANRFQLFYLVFLPMIWIAVRFGIEGASAGVVLIQLGLIAAIHLSGQAEIDVTAFQALMLVLALTGLAVGVLVSERRRAEFGLRLHQNALARVARLGSIGEMAAVLAHEINQPLTAAGNYARHAVESLSSGSAEIASASEAATKAVTQVDRAADVVRRIRALIGIGRLEKAPTSVHRIVQETLDLFHPDLDHRNITINTAISSNIPSVMADILQVEQMLLNLLRNASEAILEAGHSRGVITVEAKAGEPGFVEFCVRDSGPGFAPEIRAGELLPFSSTKGDGLGIGLPLSRSIVEKHGGKMWFGGGPSGAIVHFTLPIAVGTAHD